MTAGMRLSRYAGKSVGGYAGKWVSVVITLVLTSLPAYPLTAQTSLTIYNDGRVLVRRSVQANVPKGASTQRLSLGALDPSTIFSLDPAGTLTT